MIFKSSEYIPLRILITNKCNGQCKFCHKEGVNDLEKQDMDIEMFEKIIYAAKQEKIKKIVISGGEPTISKEIGNMIKIVKIIYPDVKLSITTNGFHLNRIISHVEDIDKINFSISSLKKEIFSRYQNVDPFPRFDILKCLEKKVCVNIVVTKDNYNELDDIIDFCIGIKISVEILFELRSYNDLELKQQLGWINIIEKKYGKFIWRVENVPFLSNYINDECYINIKHPYFNSLHEYDICLKCEKRKSCYEKICSVRVDKNGNVYPCLNHSINIKLNSIEEGIGRCYKMLNQLKKIQLNSEGKLLL